jgi:hypothetical protein
LNTNNIQIRRPQSDPAQDSVIEILIGQKSKHHALRLRLRVAPRQEFLPQALLRESFRTLFPHRFFSLFSFAEIGFHVGTMSQIKTNDRENVGQGDRWVLIRNALRRLALLERNDDRIQRNSRAANSDNTTLAHLKRRRFRFNYEGLLIPLQDKSAVKCQ